MRFLSISTLALIGALALPAAANAQFYDTNIEGNTTITANNVAQTTIVSGAANTVKAGVATIYEKTQIKGNTTITANNIAQTTIVSGADNKVDVAVASIGAPKN